MAKRGYADALISCSSRQGLSGLTPAGTTTRRWSRRSPVPWAGGCYFAAVPGSPLMDS